MLFEIDMIYILCFIGEEGNRGKGELRGGEREIKTKFSSMIYTPNGQEVRTQSRFPTMGHRDPVTGHHLLPPRVYQQNAGIQSRART